MSKPTKLPSTVRLAITPAGDRYIVQNMDLSRGIVYCWPDILGYDTHLGAKVESASRTFKRDDVAFEETTLSLDVLDRLFEQTRRTTLRTQLLEGDQEVVKHNGGRKFVKAAKASYRHAHLKCLCCGAPMRCRTLRTGATFFGCGSWGETGCNARWTPRDGWNLIGTSLEGSDLHGSDKEETA